MVAIVSFDVTKVIKVHTTHIHTSIAYHIAVFYIFIRLSARGSRQNLGIFTDLLHAFDVLLHLCVPIMPSASFVLRRSVVLEFG